MSELPSPTHAAKTSAPRVLLAAIALGLFTQLLFFRAGPGFSWFVWDVAMVGVTLGTLTRGRITNAAIATATACLLLGFAFALRRSAFSGTVALPTNLALLAALPIVVREELWDPLESTCRHASLSIL